MSEEIKNDQEADLPVVQDGQREVAELDSDTGEHKTTPVAATSGDAHVGEDIARSKRLEEQRQRVIQNSLGNVEDHWSVNKH